MPKAAPALSQEGVCGDGHPALLGGLSWPHALRFDKKLRFGEWPG